MDSIARLQRHLKENPEQHFIHRGERKVLRLFREMSERVPAYRDFLKKRKIKPETVRTISDFRQIPCIDKDSYLRAYPRSALVWDGDLKRESWTISATSGSTGEPFYFPRTRKQDEQYALTAELYLRENFRIHKRSTLYVIGFPMGIWIGGVFTFSALSLLAKRYPLSIVTPGISKIDIIKAVRSLGKDFDQVLIGSYAPFLKDVLDDASEYGLNWQDYRLGFIFSAEVFSEKFRDYLVKKTGLDDVYRGTLNHYGTVDMGTMAHETPVSILIRRRAVADPQLYASVFSDTKLPTLAQYNPEHFFFEDVGGNLIASADSGIPLVRYDLKDHGGVVGFEDMNSRLNESGLKLQDLTEEAGIADTVWHLPFVYVYERSDFSVSFFAFQIYPETVRKALQDESLEADITGKFTMQVTYTDDGNQCFQVHVELRPRIADTPELAGRIKQRIVSTLLEENSEYRKTHEMYGTRVYPEICLWPYENETHFRPGTKQKWVKK